MKPRATFPLTLRHSVRGHFVRAFKKKGGTLVVGHSRGAHIRLMSKDISGVAAVIQMQPDGSWCVLDLGSQPDLKIDGKPFVEHKVTQKCVLTIGEDSIEINPPQGRRPLFAETRSIDGASQSLTVVKWRGK